MEQTSSSTAAAKSTIQAYEVPGHFELNAKGREPRFYDNARLAGEAFYAARREDEPRVVQHYLDGFEDRTGRHETPSTRTIAITARTATPDRKLEHIFLDDSPDFKAGYEAARARLPDKAVLTEDLTQPAGPQQATPVAEYDKRQASHSTTVAQPQQEGQTMNMTRLQIDGVDVGRLAFEKHSTPQGVFVDLTALDRNEKPFAEFKGVDKIDLDKILGPMVGHEVAKFNGRTGEFAGQQLDVPVASAAIDRKSVEQEAKAPQSGIAQKTQASPVPENVSPTQGTAHASQTDPTAAPSRRLEINGQPVERLSYVKRQTEQGMRYEVTAYGSGDRVIAKHPALAKEELAAHLGETAARSLEATRGRNGSLRGEALVSPAYEAQSTREATAEVKQPQAALPPGAVPDKAVQLDWREVRRIEANKEIGPGDDTFSVTIRGIDDKVLDQQEGLTRGGLSARYGDERAAMMAQVAYQNHQAEHKPKPVEHAAEQAVTTDKQPPIVNSIEELLQKAGVVQQEDHRLPPRLQKIVDSLEKDKGERAGQPGNTQERHPDADIKIGTYALPEVPSDPAERRRQELLASLAERFTINAGEYRARHDQSQVAFVDRDKAVTTARNEPEIARAMVDLAEAKGWKGLHLKGTEPFKAAAWMEASIRGLPTHGYEPTRADRERLGIKLRERDAAMQTNRIEPMESRQGAAREQAAPAQERAAVNPQAAKAREDALGALEVYLKSQNTPKERMDVLMRQGAETLDKLVAQGKVPEVRVFDAQAQRAHTVHIQTTQQVATPQRSR